MPEIYYRDRLYPFQDRILKVVEGLNLDFYLTGGTALGRCYLNHRYSDDLDFFVNGHEQFKQQCSLAIDGLKSIWPCEVAATSDTFVRIFVESEGIELKIDFVNDVPAHFGEILHTTLFHRIDSWRNILSNKLCSLGRLEIKDIADVVFISRAYSFDWESVITEAKEKDLWVDPIEICRIIDGLPSASLKSVKWIGKVNLNILKKQIKAIRDDIFKGAGNSLSE